jgi:hypothetical protein
MTMVRNTICLLALCGLLSLDGVAHAGQTTIPPQWKNCTAVDKHYRHGVGRNNAHDKTSGTPVTSFKRSTRIYNLAMSYNRSLDRDKDGIACEKS